MIAIRKATENDLSQIQRNFARARDLMAKSGNPTQWGTTWPPEELVREDIRLGRAMLLVGDAADPAAAPILAQFALWHRR